MLATDHCRPYLKSDIPPLAKEFGSPPFSAVMLAVEIVLRHILVTIEIFISEPWQGT